MCLKKIAKSTAVMSHVGFGSFWGLRENVGYGYQNNEMDVLLVQFFLNMAARELAEEKHGCSTFASTIEEDGRFGGETWGAIKTFQKRFGNVGDGMVSAAKGDKLASPKSGRVYTLLEMNRLYAKYRRYAFNDLKMDDELPLPLFFHFQVPDFGLDE
jgi:peptidoglycan hydrolase-like protein with peptidoglycan-binding domain